MPRVNLQGSGRAIRRANKPRRISISDLFQFRAAESIPLLFRICQEHFNVKMG
jgi:hypothetical protein